MENKTRFPPFPLPLEIALRFPHSHSFDEPSLCFINLQARWGQLSPADRGRHWLTFTDAFNWLKCIIMDRLITGAGASGWMGDFGEALSFDAVLSSGESPAVWHNRYPVEWQRLQREAIEETGHGSDGLFWNRSGYSKSPGLSTLFWVGDQLQDWNGHDGLKSAISGSISGGVSGFSLVHSDIGGYDPISIPIGEQSFNIVARTRELLLRWAEFSAFSPVMRTHVGIKPGIVPQINSDPATLIAFARCVNMYRAWAPYRKELAAGYGPGLYAEQKITVG